VNTRWRRRGSLPADREDEDLHVRSTSKRQPLKSNADSLETLLDAARTSSPGGRIGYRDRIADHGKAAIDALIPWLQQQDLRGFAIRTIARIGARGHREPAVSALRTVAGDVLAHVLGDVDEALNGLGARRTTPGSASAGGPLQDTTEINDDLYTYLVGAARQGRYVTYTEAGEIVGLTMRNPHHRRLIGQVLGVISTYEAEQGRPMLSSIVVNKDQRTKLGQGFYQLGEELRLKHVGEDPDAFAKREAAKTFEHWMGRSGKPVKGGPTKTGAPDYRTRGPQEDPPPALGGCDFSGPDGQCQNPGRWDRNGLLSCTTYALARNPSPWRPDLRSVET
jgi:hypothetical protein